jgi:hypothetical protein
VFSAMSEYLVVVKCYPLSSLMNTLGQTHIDYFSLDVEVAEMIILKSIDWKHLDIDVFTIETDQHRQDILQSTPKSSES